MPNKDLCELPFPSTDLVPSGAAALLSADDRYNVQLIISLNCIRQQPPPPSQLARRVSRVYGQQQQLTPGYNNNISQLRASTDV